LAVNPYEWIPSLYGDDLAESYLRAELAGKGREGALEGLAPHVYATSARAYR
jgi:myosin heavy subunit